MRRKDSLEELSDEELEEQIDMFRRFAAEKQGSGDPPERYASFGDYPQITRGDSMPRRRSKY